MRLIAGLFALLGLIAAPALAQSPAAPAVPAPEPDNIWVLQLSTGGPVTIQLRPDKAPKTVERIKTLTRRGFYNGLTFHRVIEGFMAQGGDPTGTGEGGSELPDLEAEFNDLPHVRGTCSMARAQSPDSADSQFFICFADAPFLNGKYTVWGKVIDGMANIDKFKRGEPVRDPDRIVSMRVAADAK